MSGSAGRFRALIEHGLDLMILFDASARPVYVSPSVERILGYSTEEYLAAPSFERVHPDDRRRVQQAHRSLLERANGTEHLALRLRHANGTWRNIECTLHNLLDDPDVEAIVAHARDVTDKVRLEEQLRQAQKMEAVGRLAGGIAHDFNNLLGVVLGCADMLRRHAPPDQRTRNALYAIIDATKRGATLTRQLLTFSHREIVEPKILDINEVIEDVVPLLRRLIPEDVDIRTVLDLDVGSIEIDQSQLEQVIINLAVRARDGMPDGGIMTLETFTPDDAPRRSGLAVRDTGVGMTDDERARVFEPFFTSRDNGRDNGLGMAVVYGIVKHSGGAIECLSQPGRGARFSLSWPTVERPRPGVPDAATDAPRHAGTETVLVVEDEPQLRGLIKEMLEESGFTVLEAEDSEAALRLSQRNPGRVDLLLTDLVMPRINGRELAERLGSEQPRLRVLFMSGYTDDEIVRQGVEMSEVAFLPKPFGIDELTDKVRQTLDSLR